MKSSSLINSRVFASCVIALAFLQGCHKSKSPSPKEVNTNILVSHPWTLSSLTVDGTDKTSLYTGMTLTMTAGSYTSTHGTPVWAASGTWTLSDDGKTITRDDGILVNVDAITSDALTLSLTWTKTTYTAGRTSSVAGAHVFKFTR